MTPRILSTAWFVVFASFTAPSYAAKPEFKAGLVTESRSYYREELRTSQESTLPALAYPVRVQIERVTVALEGERITGEWYLNAGRFWVPAKDFSVRTDVQAATKGNQLLLKHPDGNVVTARIRDRVKSDEDERD